MTSLCRSCEHCQTVISGRGSTFYLCRRSLSDPRYAKYPPQPVMRCLGWRPPADQDTVPATHAPTVTNPDQPVFSQETTRE